ncbi:hypothetical protein V1511DRAFT_491725 [Dipodascopsis uninucleata]
MILHCLFIILYIIVNFLFSCYLFLPSTYSFPPHSFVLTTLCYYIIFHMIYRPLMHWFVFRVGVVSMYAILMCLSLSLLLLIEIACLCYKP